MSEIYHPQKDDHGKPVLIKSPTPPSPLDAWLDAHAVATVEPGGPLPSELNGIALRPWTDYPRTKEGWGFVDGINDDIDEPPLPASAKKPAAGAVVLESDGRVWLVHPSNQFGGYVTTMPKGRQDPGLSLQATALRETWEEAGLQVRITSYLGDFERSTTMTRLYLAERTGGLPSAMGWESQAITLAPVAALESLLNNANDKPVLARLKQVLAELHGRDGEVLQHGGNLVRVLQAIDGFYATHRHWPTKIEMRPECLLDLVTRHLTPAGFFRLQSRLKLVPVDEINIVAMDDHGHAFDYGRQGWDATNTGTSARQWLGI